AMPKHWSERDENARYPDFHARAWLIGQTATAQAALELLAHRSKRTWPEFAEYNCRACHHDLTGAPPKTIAVGEYQPATLRWNDAFTVLSQRALRDPQFPMVLEELRKEMTKPLPDAARAADQARRAAERLSRQAQQIHESG